MKRSGTQAKRNDGSSNKIFQQINFINLFVVNSVTKENASRLSYSNKKNRMFKIVIDSYFKLIKAQ